MAIRTFSQIVQNMQDGIALRQPALDTKPGSVSRDLFIDNPSDQIAAVYRDMSLIQKTQSLLNSTGKILDQFGSNYGIQRDTGKRSIGNAILTFNNILNNINISAGTTVTAKTGAVFQITANIIISTATKGIYASYAASIADQLHIAGISDQYAVQVPIESVNIGKNGDVPPYSLIKTTISGISNVTNISATIGGSNQQNDSQYRNQILAGLAGSAAGTYRGYQNALTGVSGINSVYVAIPGNPILVRDGTVTQRNSDGTITVLSPGTGGKVDIWIQGNNIVNITESYVFHDLSGIGDVTSNANAHILGQLSNSSDLTPLERRQLFTQTGQLPLQPVDSIVSLSGSISGSNFVRDVNYTLEKDINSQTQNTVFALDKILFLQDFVSISDESIAKGNLNSIDSLVFSGVKEVDVISQDIIVLNDLATLDFSERTKIIISHKPLSTVLRTTNLTTGERYTITSQNIDERTGLNETGQVLIDGSILPSAQDMIQADYTWSHVYDPEIDYFSPSNIDFLTDGIDWGRSNYIKFENAILISDTRYNLRVSRDIDRVYSAFYCDTQVASVQQANLTDQTGSIKALRQVTISFGSGPVVYFVIPGIDLVTAGVVKNDIITIYTDTATTSRAGSYTVVSVIDETVVQIEQPAIPLIVETGNVSLEITRIATPTNTIVIANSAYINMGTTAENISSITNVVSVKSQTTGLELYATESAGTFSGDTIYLSMDVSQPEIGEDVIVYFNSHEIFNIAKNNGTVSANNVVLSTNDVLEFNSVLEPLNDIFSATSVKPIFVNYIAEDIDVISRTAISLAPFIGSNLNSYFVDKNNSVLVSRQPVEFDQTNNIVRSGPSYLGFVVDGAFNSGGTLSIRGTGWFKIEASLPIIQSAVTGKINLNDVILSNIGALSNNNSVVKVVSINIDNGVSSQELLIRGYGLNNNTYDSGIAITDTSIGLTSIDLSTIFQQNGITLFTLGSTLKIVFYVLAPNISETIQFTTGRGTLYSRYKYTRISRVDLISGFLNTSNSTIVGNLRIYRLSQPNTSSIYSADYSYFGPVENERLTVRYRYNNIISDATNAIEGVRTLTADVLTRLAIQIVVNVSATVILTNQAISQSSQIIDQATSAVTSLISNNPVGALLDYTAISRVITNIVGVSSTDITVFDYVGSEFDGQANRKSIYADPNQYFSVGTLNIVSGVR